MGDELRFDGRVAVITGAARGIGRAHAMLLASRGAKVVVNDLGVGTDGTGSSIEPAQAVVDEILAAGGTAVANADTVATEAGANGVVATALDTYGRIDILVHNAGLVFVDKDLLIDVHLRAGMWLTEAAWPSMVEHGYGRIILTTSNAGLAGFDLGTSEYSPVQAYGAAKMGLVGLMRNLAHRGRSVGIQVNCLAPGAESRMEKDHPGASEVPDEEMAAILAAMPSRAPELVSPAVAWLVHEACGTTGEIFGSASGRVTRIFLAETRGFGS